MIADIFIYNKLICDQYFKLYNCKYIYKNMIVSIYIFSSFNKKVELIIFYILLFFINYFLFQYLGR